MKITVGLFLIFCAMFIAFAPLFNIAIFSYKETIYVYTKTSNDLTQNIPGIIKQEPKETVKTTIPIENPQSYGLTFYEEYQHTPLTILNAITFVILLISGSILTVTGIR